MMLKGAPDTIMEDDTPVLAAVGVGAGVGDGSGDDARNGELGARITIKVQMSTMPLAAASGGRRSFRVAARAERFASLHLVDDIATWNPEHFTDNDHIGVGDDCSRLDQIPDRRAIRLSDSTHDCNYDIILLLVWQAAAEQQRGCKGQLMRAITVHLPATSNSASTKPLTEISRASTLLLAHGGRPPPIAGP